LKKQSYALGMVETIGFPALVAAADAAAKAADVKVTTYQKADSGIVTIYIIGDVASVKSAVDTGREAAKRVGQFRHSHVIPRPDDHVIKMLFPELIDDSVENAVNIKQHEIIAKDTSNKEFNKMNLQEIRELANSIEGFPLPSEEISRTKKEELLNIIVKFQATKGGEK
jgi:microcompartment protein CcmL/EutN